MDPHLFRHGRHSTFAASLGSRCSVAARGLTKSSATELEAEAGKIFGPLYELAVQLRDQHHEFVNSYAFLPIAAEVYVRHSIVEPLKGANTQEERIRRAARCLRDFARWFEHVGANELPPLTDPCILWAVFKRDFDKRAGQVFIAMSFKESKTLDGVQKAVEEAIKLFNDGHPNSPLAPMRIDKQGGESYEIPARVFHEIDDSRLLIADLTEEKQNVYREVGYAKARGIPFFLTFQKKTPDAGKTTAGALNKVHFDLAPYRYIEYETTHDLRDKLKQELESWHDRT